MVFPKGCRHHRELRELGPTHGHPLLQLRERRGERRNESLPVELMGRQVSSHISLGAAPRPSNSNDAIAGVEQEVRG
jgi:hypothetical protein